MRVVMSHNKGRAEGKKAVDDAVESLLRSEIPGPFRLGPVRKQWEADTLRFETAVTMGFARMPVRGLVGVTDTEISIDVHLPPMLAKFIPEKRLAESVESRIRGRLASGNGTGPSGQS